MKFVLYLIIFLVAGAIVRYLVGSGQETRPTLEPGDQRPDIPDLATLRTWLLDKACEQCGEAVRNDPLAISRLSESAEKTWQEISRGEKAEINLPYLIADQSGPKHFNILIDCKQIQRI